jgi:hypothetical protein
VNRKRIRQLYRLDSLQLQHAGASTETYRLAPGPAPCRPARPSAGASDVVHDALADGRPFRVLTVVTSGVARVRSWRRRPACPDAR